MRKLSTQLALLLFFINSFGQQATDLSGNHIESSEAVNKEFNSNTNLPPLIPVRQVQSPIEFPNALAFDGTDLWLAGQNEFFIYKISMSDGTIIDSIPIELSEPYAMTYFDDHFWVADSMLDSIYRIDTSGNVVDIIPLPGEAPHYIQGLVYDGERLWINDTRIVDFTGPEKITYVTELDGTIITQFDAVGNFPTGLAWDGSFIYTADLELNEVHKVDPLTFSIVETFTRLNGIPLGLAFDGQYLWLADNQTDYIYQYDIDFVLSTNDTIEPSNLNRVHPNPSSDYIQVSEVTKASSYQIHNLMGMEVSSGTLLPNGSIDIQDLAVGLYFLKLNNQQILKFIRN